ncbi:MAG TPA: hypothetical protein PLV85_09770, partial [Polyangiaceae bacterium]|nr:hypothetical protein [Polyangiaceae bacterium]
MNRIPSRICGALRGVALGMAISCTASMALGQESTPLRRLDEQRAVRVAMANNPSFRTAVLDLQRANESVRFEDGRYPYTLQLEAGVTRSATPRVNADSVSIS